MDESRVPWVTWRSVLLGAFVSIGGIIFGYDTGQISGFLEMHNFKQRFAQLKPDGTYSFSNVRSGLIVSMVSGYRCISLKKVKKKRKKKKRI